MRSFNIIYEEAVLRHGSGEAVEKRLPVPSTPDELIKKSNAFYLDEMSRRIFRAGLRHNMVDAKWPAFRRVFHEFDIDKVRLMSDEQLEQLMHDKRIIRHWAKIKAVRNNAQAFHELLQVYDSAGSYLADWPTGQVIELWADLKKHFSQMGGNSGPYFLRMVGKDTFLLTDHVVKALTKWGEIDRRPAGKKSLAEVQDCMAQWSMESRRPLCQVSMILALTVD
ncbi:MAG TPA: DNA-3-methyladenine glycosylase I [Gammaproteobacteria bacterium]|nr:DNA-3-methyladenine glycosylase I [Gammaproteobacteria bacterium]